MGMMNWGMAKLYDAVMRKVETASLGQWRRELLRDLDGDVLEIGAGTGVNLAYYPDRLDRLVLTEPDRHMRARLVVRMKNLPVRHEVVDATAEKLPFPDNSFDVAVVTLVLCSVEHPDRSLGELYRVLKPGGKLALIEHVAAFEPGLLHRWQQRLEPIWKRCAGNCHLARDTRSAIRLAGFNCDGLQQDHMHGAPAIASPTIRGIAEKPEFLADLSYSR